MTADKPLRRVWLCADDYGMSPGVNRAIRDLIERQRINATSVMVVGLAVQRSEIDALKSVLGANSNCAVGLHVTLTAPFAPLTLHFKPLRDGQFLPLSELLIKSMMRSLDDEIVQAELTAQIAAFKELFGRPPDYLDGHQHVQLFPKIRDAFLNAVKSDAPNAWVRQCGRATPLSQRMKQPKALLLDTLSAPFRQKCRAAGIVFNPAFAGAYDFVAANDFGDLMREFLAELPDGGLAMCHPGFVDDTLLALDPLTHQREREHEYLSSDAFAAMMAASGITLARR